MKLEIHLAKDVSDFEKIEFLAFTIIPEAYTNILTEEHCLFFVKNFQSKEAIACQVLSGYEYYLISSNGILTGYASIYYSIEKAELKLSKLYILESGRRSGIGSRIMEFILQRAEMLMAKKITLIVNTQNIIAIKFYESFGFSVLRKIENRYENGYLVFDYEMQLDLK